MFSRKNVPIGKKARDAGVRPSVWCSSILSDPGAKGGHSPKVRQRREGEDGMSLECHPWRGLMYPCTQFLPWTPAPTVDTLYPGEIGHGLGHAKDTALRSLWTRMAAVGRRRSRASEQKMPSTKVELGSRDDLYRDPKGGTHTLSAPASKQRPD